jgi:preprotein translocase subunit SecB
MQQPPIHLRDHVFTKINIEAKDIGAVQDGIKKNIPFGYEFSFACEVYQSNPQERRFRVEMNIVSHEKEGHLQGYSIDVTIAGLFEVDKRVAEAEIPKMLSILGPALLLGAAREFIYTVTGRGPCKAVYLPTVNFVPPPDKPIKRKPQEEVAKKKPAPKKKATKK